MKIDKAIEAGAAIIFCHAQFKGDDHTARRLADAVITAAKGALPPPEPTEGRVKVIADIIRDELRLVTASNGEPCQECGELLDATWKVKDGNIDHIAKLIAALSLQDRADDWQDIDTWSPGNAAAYWPYLTAMVVSDGEVMQAHWKPQDNPPATGEWWPANLDSEYCDRIYPTHWRPLPAAPMVAEDRVEGK